MLIAAAVVIAIAGAVLAWAWWRRRPRKRPSAQTETASQAARRRALERASERPAKRDLERVPQPPAPPQPPPALPPVALPTPAPLQAPQVNAGQPPALALELLPKVDSGLSHLVTRIQLDASTIEVRSSQSSRAATAAMVNRADLQKDAWEDDGYYDAYRDGKKLTVELNITYRDSNGQETNRRVETERYAHDDRDGIMYAQCHLRGQQRSFRFSRVLAATDPSTGEAITHLPSWLDGVYAKSDEGQVDGFVLEHEAALTALFYVAKADGAFRQSEKKAIEELCDEWDLFDPIVFDLLMQRVSQWNTPSAIAYGKALREIAQQPREYRQQVYDTAKQMSAGKKTLRDTEVRALARMRKELDLPTE